MLCLVPWEWGQIMSRGDNRIRVSDETEVLDLEERSESEDLKLPYLLCLSSCFSDRLGWQVPRENMWQLGAGTAGCVVRNFGKDLHDQLEMGTERIEKQQQVVCYRDGSESWELDFEE